MSLNCFSYESFMLLIFNGILPLALWGIIWWCGHQSRLSFLEIVCIYAYSLFVYIPVSGLWIMQIGWLQWFLVLIGTALSGSDLLITIWPSIKQNRHQDSYAFVIIMFLVHLLLAVGSMLYLYHDPLLAKAEAADGW